MQLPQVSSAPSLDSSGIVGSPRQWNLCFSPSFCLHTFSSALWGWTCRELWTPWPEVPKSTLGSYTGRPLQTPVPAAHTVAPQHYLCTQVLLCAQASASAHQQYGHLFLWIFQCRHQGAVPWLCDFYLLNGPRLIDSWTHQNIQSGFSCWFPIPSINRPHQFYLILLVVLCPRNIPLILSLSALNFPSPFMPSHLFSAHSYSSCPSRSSSNSSSFVKSCFSSYSHHHSFSSYKACLCHIIEWGII